MTGNGRRLSRMTGSGREASRVVGRLTRMSGTIREALTGGQEAHPDVQEWSGGRPGCSGVVVRPSRKFGSGWEAFPDVQEWLGSLPG